MYRSVQGVVRWGCCSRITNERVGTDVSPTFAQCFRHPLPLWEKAGVRGRLHVTHPAIGLVERARWAEVRSKISRISYSPSPSRGEGAKSQGKRRPSLEGEGVVSATDQVSAHAP